jgi:Tol biopolymer transport system component
MPIATNESPMEDALDGLIHVTQAAQGADFDPCISRDGSVLVFASTQHRETADIYVKSVSGRTVTQLTADPAHDVMPTISPDGQRIAFASNRGGNWDIFVMSAGGGQAVQLTSDFAHELHPSWSPDGAKIVFCRLGEISGRWELWVMDANGSASTEFVGYGMFPDWCPVSGTGASGRDKILFQRSRERGDRAFSIWTVDYQPGDTSSPTEIASSRDAALINASWSPDGNRVVFATLNHRDLTADPTPSGTPASDLWIVGVDGTGRVSLTGGRFMNLMPTWGPDYRIYFVSDRTGVSNIWSVGTEKAIVAATGKPMSRGPQTEITNVPTDATDPATAP